MEAQELLLAALVWTAVAAAIVIRFVSDRLLRIALFAVLFGIPFGELPYGYYNFLDLCQSETVLQVSEKIPAQETVCVEELNSLMYTNLMRAGFARVEVTSDADYPSVYLVDRRVVRTHPELTKSPYCIVVKKDIVLPWNILRSDTLIVDSRNQQTVARQSAIHWQGMWWQKDLIPSFGSGRTCSGNPGRPAVALRKGAG